jgi:hypothetical protein
MTIYDDWDFSVEAVPFQRQVTCGVQKWQCAHASPWDGSTWRFMAVL